MAAEELRLAVMGDCMLGRLVNFALLRRALIAGCDERLQVRHTSFFIYLTFTTKIHTAFLTVP